MLIQISKLNNRKSFSQIINTFYINLCLLLFNRMPAPKLPTWQDCHELWSKKRRRQQREQESLQTLPSGKSAKDIGGSEGTAAN